MKAFVTNKKDKKKDTNFTRMDESKIVDTMTFLIDHDPNEKNKRSYTEAGSGKINMIQNTIEESPKKINASVTFSNDAEIKIINLKDFNFIKIIGRGNISKTFLVQYQNNKKYYALKSIQKDMIVNTSSIKKQSKLIQNLKHPFLTPVHFCFETNERVYFALSYIQGEELSYHINTYKNFDEEKVKFYVASLILVLDYLHKNEIIYRDFTPNNIIIDSQGYIRLTPFHFETIYKIKKEILDKIEKNEYNSPEAFSDTGSENLRGSDWWNLGVIMFEMIYSVPPFYIDDINELKNFINKTELKFPKNPTISEDAKDLIKNLVNKNVEERLGYKNGLEEFKNHPFFKDFDFENLLNKKMESPYKSKVGDIMENNKKFEEKYTYEDLIKNGLINTN